MYTILGIIAKPMGWLLGLLYEFIQDYGITIIVFTIIVKLCIYPLYIKQTKSMAKMQDVQPKMQALQRKYANDKETLNIKMAELYKEEKFNPMGGCLPMLIQMPIIMGLFVLLRQPTMYISDDSMIFAFHESFLWIEDLSQPDPWILPIIAGVGTFVSFTMNQMLNESTNNQVAGMMKMMQFIFPIMILWMARAFPSGLALYWAVSQVIQIFFNIHMASIRKKMKREKEAAASKKKMKK
ncbi:MAG: YidC/Oxa1 family membrane protein insertase [Anaerovoracaceae bacterium]|nr:YidC/Oxa1 family membrane protein insertase [Anaerovoracaceae bacterium]